MRKVFQEELTHVGDQLVEISRLVSEAMDKATTSFEVADVDLAQDVIAADARIDFLQNSLDERAIDPHALFLDHPFRRAARGHSGMREDFVEPFFHPG